MNAFKSGIAELNRQAEANMRSAAEASRLADWAREQAEQIRQQQAAQQAEAR
ncbi:hypothetical protein [Kitasatospora sp. NPDC088346]|uniref:hypothetical protein n=1 Tax=Kitasatospora sp. NPDC088346 TaxID=3364073 RepID=UPI0038206299